MNKRNKPFVLLAGALVLLLGAYFAVTAIGKSRVQRQAAEEAAAATVSSLRELTALAAANAGGEGLSFVKDGGGWRCEQYAAWPVDQNAVESYAALYTGLSAARVLTEHGALADYGLDAPQYVFTAADGEGNTETLLLSEHENGRRYAALDGDARVFVIETALTQYAAYDIYKWIDYEEIPYLSEDGVTAITLARGGNVYAFTRYTLPAEGAAAETDDAAPVYGWRAQKDGITFEPVAANVETALYDLAAVAQVDCAAYDLSAEGLASYGFDGSETVLTVTDGGALTVLRVGRSATLGGTLYYYLMVNGDAAVTTAKAAGIDELFSLLMSGGAAKTEE